MWRLTLMLKMIEEEYDTEARRSWSSFRLSFRYWCLYYGVSYATIIVAGKLFQA
jgi:hypothetical protein